jgi:hypothetical protein
MAVLLVCVPGCVGKIGVLLYLPFNGVRRYALAYIP